MTLGRAQRKKNETVSYKYLDNIKTCGCRVGMRAVNGKLIIQLEWPDGPLTKNSVWVSTDPRSQITLYRKYECDTPLHVLV